MLNMRELHGLQLNLAKTVPLLRSHGVSMSVPLPTPPHNIWLQRFKRLAQLTASLNSEDPRFPIIMTLLEKCDRDYRTDNHASFIETGKRIRSLMDTPITS